MKEVCFVVLLTRGSRIVVFFDSVAGSMVVEPTLTTLWVVPSEVAFVVFTAGVVEVRSEVGTFEVVVVPSLLLVVMGMVVEEPVLSFLLVVGDTVLDVVGECEVVGVVLVVPPVPTTCRF